ncbi:hypothetical protein AB1K84_21565 [Mesobacillus foraminis]|uniref:hypothetical protein n=1 Tax=Mesobacillus foraminis TaxID=279826 RepID=UPI0039A220B0
MNKKPNEDRVAFLEEQVNDYMKKLLVDSPYLVLMYFEKQVKRYSTMLEQGIAFPASVEITLQHLIEHYSSLISLLKEYIHVQIKAEKNSSGDYMT